MFAFLRPAGIPSKNAITQGIIKWITEGGWSERMEREIDQGKIEKARTK